MQYTIKFNSTEDVERFVKECNHYQGDINVYDGSIMIDGKSILGMTSLDISHVLTIELISEDMNEHNYFSELISTI